MQCGHVWKKKIKCNWKLFWENFNECLHCPNIYPELVDLVPLCSRRIINKMDLPNWETHNDSIEKKHTGELKDGAETWSTDGSSQGRSIKNLSSEDLARGQLYASAWPSVFIAGYADHVRVVRVIPLDTESIELTAEWLFEPETLNDPNYDIRNIIDFGTLVMEQDGRACELNQMGLRAEPFKGAVLMPEEYLLKKPHDWIRS